MTDSISRQSVFDIVDDLRDRMTVEGYWSMVERVKALQSAQPERLTDDDFETIRIHLNAYKEKLCNQHRWEEADKYQRIIDRFMAFASAQPEQTNSWCINSWCNDCKDDAISRAEAIRVASGYCHPANIAKELEKLPSAQPEIKPIDYQDCANAMLRMWMDKVVTDGEYNRIMDKLNAFWGDEK